MGVTEAVALARLLEARLARSNGLDAALHGFSNAFQVMGQWQCDADSSIYGGGRQG